MADVKRGRYFPSTGICKECYKQGQQAAYGVWCFGKKNVVVKGKTVHYGYDTTAVECRNECPDRAICKIFVEQSRKEQHE